MKFVFLLMADHAGLRCGEEDAPGEDAFARYEEELQKAGVFVEGGFALHDPSEAVSVTRDDPRKDAVVTAGPFLESREFVGGSWVIDVTDMDEAVAWAKRCPGAVGGRVEIRQMYDF